MELLKWEIEDLESRLKELKENQKQSFESVKKHWNSTYHSDLKDKCEMIYMLAQGKSYNPYNFRDDLKFSRGENWKSKEYFDFCHIYKGFGNPSGFVSLECGLFHATQSKHKKMWLWAIKNEKEENSFENFSERLKTDIEFLIKSFNNHLKEVESGAYSTQPYLVEFEDKRLKSGKFYIYLEGTSRKY